MKFQCDMIAIKRHNEFQNRDAFREGRDYIASQWITIPFLETVVHLHGYMHYKNLVDAKKYAGGARTGREDDEVRKESHSVPSRRQKVH